MDSNFNPDEYLKQKSAPGGFDPDAYLASKSPAPETATGPAEAVFTNKPTDGFLQHLARYSPAMAAAMAAAPEGAAMGAAAGSVAGPIGTVVGGAAGGIGAAAIGGFAGESARQAVAQGVAASMPQKKYPMLNPTQLVNALNSQAKEQAINETAGIGIGAGLKMGGRALASVASEKLPGVLKNSVGIPEPITKYVQNRGSGSVFSPANLNEGAALDNVAQATGDLAARRSSVGSAVGTAEDAALQKVGGKSAGVRHIREGLEKELYGRGITDPDTSPLARSKEAGVLKNLVEVLTPSEKMIPNEAGLGVTKVPVSEKLTVKQAINAKRLIDSQLDFAGKELSTSTEQLLKKVNHQLRVSVRADLGPAVSKLWDDFGAIADAQDKLSEFTGTRALSSTQQRAVQALRGIMLKNPGEVDNIVKVLGAGLPGGEQQARTIFDSIAANPFTKGGIGAPSSSAIKTLTAGGVLSGPMARSAVRGSEALTNFAARPMAVPRKTTYAALEALRNMRDDNGP